MRRILEGNEINGGELPFLWPTSRARSTFRAFLFRPEYPSASQKAGMTWTHRMDKNPNLNKNKKPKARLNRITLSRMKKKGYREASPGDA
jgi:hypothetical protein